MLIVFLAELFCGTGSCGFLGGGEVTGGVGGVTRKPRLTERRRSRDVVMTESGAERWSLSWEPHIKTHQHELVGALLMFTAVWIIWTSLYYLMFYVLVGLFNKVWSHTHWSVLHYCTSALSLPNHSIYTISDIWKYTIINYNTHQYSKPKNNIAIYHTLISQCSVTYHVYHNIA